MTQIKIFHEDDPKNEELINEWLASNPNYRVIDIKFLYSCSGNRYAYMVLYEK